MRAIIPIVATVTLALYGCGASESSETTVVEAEDENTLGSYDIDPQSGEVRATHTDAAGVTTTMRAGETVPAQLPEPFLPYPGATITNTTLVEQGEGAFVTVEFTTPDERPKVVEFYRKQAIEAGIEPEIEISGGATTTLGGENDAKRASFALQVTRVSDLTEGQISVVSGFD